MATTVGLIIEDIKEKFKCPHCEKEYATMKKLEKHIAEEHDDKSEV